MFKTLEQYPILELKQIYQLLHNQIASNPALMDSELLHDMQRYLQQAATRDGVDVSLHAEWSAWLNGSS